MGETAGATSIAVVGCGAVLPMYFPAMLRWPHIEVASWSDVIPSRAEGARTAHGVGEVLPVEEAVASPRCDLVLNLTPSAVHGSVTRLALEHDKAVYSEKPLDVDLARGRALVGLAGSASVRLGAAPDTFLGSTPQAALRCVDEGLIGVPHTAVAAFTGGGSADRLDDPLWPGTLMDVGVYYVTALVTLLGPVAAVSGAADNFLADLASPGVAARRDVNTHFAAVLRFASGAIGLLLVGFGLGRGSLPHVEIHGTEGTLTLPNPNFFTGPLVHRPLDGSDPYELVVPDPPPAPGAWDNRGVGLADLVFAIGSHRSHRTSAELALHVLDIMSAIETTSATGAAASLDTSFDRPAPIPPHGFEEQVPPGGAS